MPIFNLRTFGFFWRGLFTRIALMLHEGGKRELIGYGFTFGQVFFGVIVSIERTKTDNYKGEK